MAYSLKPGNEYPARKVYREGSIRGVRVRAPRIVPKAKAIVHRVFTIHNLDDGRKVFECTCGKRTEPATFADAHAEFDSHRRAAITPTPKTRREAHVWRELIQ